LHFVYFRKLETISNKEESMERIKDEFGLYPEIFFDDLLSRERKRSQRSKNPFAMIMIDMGLLISLTTKESIRELVAVLDECFREFDIKGWHKEKRVIGILCPEIRCSKVELLQKKVERAIEQTLPQTFRKNLTVSSLCFPQAASPESPKLDRCVYPELKTNCLKKIFSKTCKRSIDIILTSMLLAVCFPFMVLIAVVIKLTSPGPVFFRQERIGLGGAAFTLLKFRSMKVCNDTSVHKEFVTNFIKAQNTKSCETSGAFKIVNDRRITFIGGILRKSSLDELPQLINVLRGEMSLVGPRPPIQYEVDIYDIWHRRRMMEVKPGITGYWQVYGRSRTSFENMVRMDIHYIQYRNLLFDMSLILKTPFSLVRGAY
jgi:lipopolysaccharide/colanic/teichoic acid biosynthesis glycosyltransferase